MIAGSAAAADLRARATPYGLQRMRRRQPRAAGCEHGRQHSVCKECGGNGICEHGRRRTRCKECRGGNTGRPRDRRNEPEPAQAEAGADPAEADGAAPAAKVEDDDAAPAPPLTGMAAVRAALRALGIGQYADAFEKLGFDDLVYLREVASGEDGRARIGDVAKQAGSRGRKGATR